MMATAKRNAPSDASIKVVAGMCTVGKRCSSSDPEDGFDNTFKYTNDDAMNTLPTFTGGRAACCTNKPTQANYDREVCYCSMCMMNVLIVFNTFGGHI